MDNKLKDINIDQLELPIRVLNALKMANIETVDEINATPDEKLLGIRTMTKTHLRDLRERLAVFERELTSPLNNIFDGHLLAKLLGSDINRRHRSFLTVDYIYSVIEKNLDIFDMNRPASAYINDIDAMRVLYNDAGFVSAIEKMVVYVLTATTAKCTFDEFYEYLPKSFLCTGRLMEVLQKLMKNNKIDFYLNKYSLMYETLDEYLSKLPQDEQNVIRWRLEGKTYKDIDIECGHKRGYASRIVTTMAARHCKIFENRYIYWFTKYDIDQVLFCDLFGVKPYIYNYMMLAYHKGSGSLSDIRFDPYITNDQIRKLDVYVGKSNIYENGTVISKHRRSIIRYIMRVCHSEEAVDKNIVEKEYIAFCKKHGLDPYAEGMTFPVTFENDRSYRFIVLSDIRKIRYYDMDRRNVGRMLSCIDFSKYMDKVVSALKIFWDNKDLMDQYDIHDEYELHNICKKNKSMLPVFVELGRTPILNIGEANRDKQVMDVFKKNPTMTKADLARLFRDEYGVDEASFKSGWCKCIDDFGKSS